MLSPCFGTPLLAGKSPTYWTATDCSKRRGSMIGTLIRSQGQVMGLNGVSMLRLRLRGHSTGVFATTRVKGESWLVAMFRMASPDSRQARALNSPGAYEEGRSRD